MLEDYIDNHLFDILEDSTRFRSIFKSKTNKKYILDFIEFLRLKLGDKLYLYMTLRGVKKNLKPYIVPGKLRHFQFENKAKAIMFNDSREYLLSTMMLPNQANDWSSLLEVHEVNELMKITSSV